MAWFDSFASAVTPEANAIELSAITSFAPPEEFPALLDVGCGTGRTATGLVTKGYTVTGIDINAGAIAIARKNVATATFVVLDQREISQLSERFDVALVLWNSLGFSSREDDTDVLRGIGNALRSGGRLLLDLYHPWWLARNEQQGVRDHRGITVNRWLRDGRSYHRISYPNGTSDDIQFNVYTPDEMVAMLQTAGFETGAPMTWWDAKRTPSETFARYQIVCIRR